MNDEIESLLTAKGISPTAMRILVLEYLLKQRTAVSLQNLEHDFQHSDRTTLYRTLKTFEEKSLIHHIKDGSDSTKYALCAEACREGLHYDLHLHFYCNSCKQTICLPKHEVPDVKLPLGFVLAEINLVANGICNTCNQKNAIQLHDIGG